MIPVPFVAFVVGAVIGSFLNVVIHRLPRKESIVRPGSRCPSCGCPIRPWDNVPIVSWLVLRGRCRACGARISPRYPAVELLVAAGFALLSVADRVAPWQLLRDLALFSLLVPIAFIDADHRIIPDELSLGGAAAALLLSALPGGDWKASLAGGVVGAGVLYGSAWAYERFSGVEGMGGGDVKLLAMVGAFLGWRGALLTIFAGSLLGIVGGLWAMRTGGKGLKTAIPWGPYLCAAALVARFLGERAWGLLLPTP